MLTTSLHEELLLVRLSAVGNSGVSNDGKGLRRGDVGVVTLPTPVSGPCHSCTPWCLSLLMQRPCMNNSCGHRVNTRWSVRLQCWSAAVNSGVSSNGNGSQRVDACVLEFDHIRIRSLPLLDIRVVDIMLITNLHEELLLVRPHSWSGVGNSGVSNDGELQRVDVGVVRLLTPASRPCHSLKFRFCHHCCNKPA